MITPVFTVEQDEEFVTLKIKCPFLKQKAQEIEMDVNAFEFKFYGKPYYLRLTFPGQVHEDGREKAIYDISAGLLTVVLPKVTKGEHFKDLDLLTTLLSVSSKTKNNPLIINEHMSGIQQVSAMDTQLPQRPLIQVLDPPAELETEEFDWHVEQEIPNAETLTSKPYGFNNLYSGYVGHIHALAHETLDLNVEGFESCNAEDRRQFYKAREDLKWDQDYLMYEASVQSNDDRGDFMYDEEIQRLLQYKTKFYKALKHKQQQKDAMNPPNNTETQPHGEVAAWLEFSEKEQKKMLNIKNKEYLIDNPKQIYLGLVDILFAYCYNHRTMEGENTVESAWTICKLSATLCCFDASRLYQGI